MAGASFYSFFAIIRPCRAFATIRDRAFEAILSVG